MKRRLLRRLLPAGAALGAAAGVLTASMAGAAPHGQLTEQQILRIALRAAARSGDPRPTLVQHTQGTRADANRLTAGAYTGGSAWSYLIALRGHFIAYGASIPAGAKPPRGSVITLVVNAATGQGTDSGITYTYPRLARLGPVTTDFRSYPSCPRSDRRRLTSITPDAATSLVPPGAAAVLLCRYSGLNPTPAAASRLLVQRLVSSRPLVRQLAERLDALPPFPSGSFSCPADFGVEIVAIFRYAAQSESDDPVSVDPGGCASVTNGHATQAAMFPPGVVLVSQLERLTRTR